MEEREVELIDYINVIVKRKRLILVGTLACVLAAAVYGFTHKPPTLYEAKSSLLVIPPPFKADLTPPSLSVFAYEKLARAQDLEQAVIDSLRLPYDINGLDGMLTVEVVKETTSGSVSAPASPLITLSVKSDRKDLSAQIVNAWADLFVRRNSGISTRAVSGSYDFIISQYEAARKRLEETEDTILRFKAENPLSPLSNERTAEATKLGEVQTAYTNQQWDLKAKEAALKHQEELLRAVETDGKLVVSLGEEERPVSFEGLTEDQKKIRKLIVEAKREQIQAEKELLAFNLEHRVEFLKAEMDKKNQTLVEGQAELLAIDLRRKMTQLTLEQTNKHLQQQNFALVLSKAITDDALWQKAQDGALSPTDMKKWDSLKLRSEQLNPVYSDLMQKKAALQLEYDSYAPKEILLQDQIERLKKEIPSLMERFQAEERKQATLVRRVETTRAIFNVYQESYATTRASVEKLQLEINALKKDLSYTQSAQEMSKSKMLGLDDRIGLMQLEQARVERDVGMYKSTFDRFAKLAEDARIAKAGEVSDVRVVERAVTYKVISPSGSRNVGLAGAVGLVAMVFLAFLIEYLEKAQQRKEG